MATTYEPYNPFYPFLTRADLESITQQYALGVRLGAGSFGIVARGMRKTDGAPVAIKFIKRNRVWAWVDNPEGGEGAKEPLESSILRELQDIEGVIRLIEVIDHPKGVMIVMESPRMCVDLFDLIQLHGPMD